ncbi:MAG: HIT domain-containing protein, partial [FCB group bacterium]
MEILWSSWRSKYIESFKDENDSQCIFCNAVENPGKDSEMLVVARREKCFVILNRYPYNGGHVMIAPYRHVAEFGELSIEELTGIMETIQETIKILCKISKPQGYNIGANIGRVSGAGIPGHIHFHLVPRWNGDTSFMPVCADTKIVS